MTRMKTRCEIIEKAIICSLQYEGWRLNPFKEAWQLALFCTGMLLGLIWNESMGAPILEHFDNATGPWLTEYEYSGYDDEPPNEIEWYGHHWLPIVMVADW
jgi:hypothetical protein